MVKDMESKIMEVSRMANECKLRKEKYIDASIGVLKNNQHELISFRIIEKLLKININNQTCNYSSILGSNEFNEEMCRWVFKRKLTCYHSSGFVMGATAALSFTFNNYCHNKVLILPSLRWPNYDLIAKKNDLKLIEYEMIDKNQKFNIDGLKTTLERQYGDFSILINDPCSNPLGYTITFDEWNEILTLIKKETQTRKITLILDLAYLDLTFSNYSNIFKLMEDNLSKNFDIVACYSFSKSFSLYGYRGGIVIGLFDSFEKENEFNNRLKFFIRSTWSSCNNLLTTVVSQVLKNKMFRKLIELKQCNNRYLLKNRIDYFKKIATQYNVKYFEFYEGFFVYLKLLDAEKIYKYLLDKKIFVIPFNDGIRISIASINKKEILLILKEINNINKLF